MRTSASDYAIDGSLHYAPPDLRRASAETRRFAGRRRDALGSNGTAVRTDSSLGIAIDGQRIDGSSGFVPRPSEEKRERFPIASTAVYVANLKSG
jgi:hypothetical protein